MLLGCENIKLGPLRRTLAIEVTQQTLHSDATMVTLLMTALKACFCSELL